MARELSDDIREHLVQLASEKGFFVFREEKFFTMQLSIWSQG